MQLLHKSIQPSFNASLTLTCSISVIRLALSNHFKALAGASNSTDKITKLDNVDTANKIIPINKTI